MLPPPPRSTLFPYTTLFRSEVHQAGAADQAHDRGDAGLDPPEEDAPGSAGFLVGHVRPSLTVDRKSTRLNSSHMSISYAVFCLKKKKKINNVVRLSANLSLI